MGKRIKLQEEVRQRKLPVYETQIQLLFSVLFASREGISPPTEQDVIKAFRAFTERILIWGGPNVIKAWSGVRLHDWTGGDPVKGFLKFEAFVKAIRTELGNSNSALMDGDLLKLFINDFDPAKLRALAASSKTENVGPAAKVSQAPVNEISDG